MLATLFKTPNTESFSMAGLRWWQGASPLRGFWRFGVWLLPGLKAGPTVAVSLRDGGIGDRLPYQIFGCVWGMDRVCGIIGGGLRSLRAPLL